jgi:hypothetical protein
MLDDILRLAGVGQLILAAGSLAIPRVLNWPDQLRSLPKLTRQVFWTYAAYIWVTHVCFGALTLAAPAAIHDGSLLAGVVSGFIALWWSARIVIQFTYFDRSATPPGIQFKLAEIGLVLLFMSLAAIYGWAVLVNFGWLP